MLLAAQAPEKIYFQCLSVYVAFEVENMHLNGAFRSVCYSGSHPYVEHAAQNVSAHFYIDHVGPIGRNKLVGKKGQDVCRRKTYCASHMMALYHRALHGVGASKILSGCSHIALGKGTAHGRRTNVYSAAFEGFGLNHVYAQTGTLLHIVGKTRLTIAAKMVVVAHKQTVYSQGTQHCLHELR